MTSRHGHSLLSLSYTLLLYFISPLLLTLTVVQALRTRDSRYLRQRFGFYQRTQFPKPVWIHAASVGEVIAAEPLVHSLKKRFPQIPIIVTTGTPAGGGSSSASLSRNYRPCLFAYRLSRCGQTLSATNQTRLRTHHGNRVVA